SATSFPDFHSLVRHRFCGLRVLGGTPHGVAHRELLSYVSQHGQSDFRKLWHSTHSTTDSDETARHDAEAKTHATRGAVHARLRGAGRAGDCCAAHRAYGPNRSAR